MTQLVRSNGRWGGGGAVIGPLPVITKAEKVANLKKALTHPCKTTNLPKAA